MKLLYSKWLLANICLWPKLATQHLVKLAMFGVRMSALLLVMGFPCLYSLCLIWRAALHVNVCVEMVLLLVLMF